jgi:hypothetical protein
MARELLQDAGASNHVSDADQHVCPLPWPIEPSLSEGHQCECGRRWAYQPAHWEPLFTIDELRERQRNGRYSRSCL